MLRNTVTIAKKELSTYFTTLIAYAGLGAFAFLMGIFFVTSLNRFQQLTNYYLAQQQPTLLEQLNFNDVIIVPMFNTGLWMFLFFVPFLAMRLFAEEKSEHTFELLMTAPLSSLELVLGKFLGAAFVVSIMAILPLIFPLILSMYGSGSGPQSGVEWTPLLAASFCILLLGLSFVAMALFASSLSDSQIVAALSSFALLLFCFVLPIIAARIDGDWRSVVEYLSPLTHIVRGLQGRIWVGDLVYFATTIFFFLFLTQRVIEAHRWRG